MLVVIYPLLLILHLILPMFIIPLPQVLVPILSDIGTVPLLNHSMCLTQYVMFLHFHDPVLQRLLPLLIMQQLLVMHLIL